MGLLDHTPKQITPELVKSLWSYMTRVYGTKIINKNNSSEMMLVSQALSRMGILDQNDFMSKFTTTIGHGIYIPFEIGDPSGYWSLESQIVVCAHEHQHVVQYDADNWGFYYSYLTDTNARAKYETEAYRSDLEFEMFYNRTLPNISNVAHKLTCYGLNSTQVHVAEVSLQSAARMVSKGMILNQATKTALSVL